MTKRFKIVPKVTADQRARVALLAFNESLSSSSLDKPLTYNQQVYARYYIAKALRAHARAAVQLQKRKARERRDATRFDRFTE